MFVLLNLDVATYSDVLDTCVFFGLFFLFCLLLLFFFCRIKEKFPYAFDDICLYSEVSYLLAHCMFRLPSRRFIQELFQDVPFIPVREKTTLKF